MVCRSGGRSAAVAEALRTWGLDAVNLSGGMTAWGLAGLPVVTPAPDITGLVVHRIYNGYWFWGRPSLDDLWHDLRELMSQTRPDWDLSAPGLRAAWEAGDTSRFHGWDKNPKAAAEAKGKK